jgi:hypothetical protein
MTEFYELSHSQKNLIFNAVRYYQMNKTVVDSKTYTECESVLNMFWEAHMFPPAYNTEDEDPIPLDQVEFD